MKSCFTICIWVSGIIAICNFETSAQPFQPPMEDFSSIPILKWKFEAGNKIFSSPVFSNGMIYAGGSDSILHAIDLNTGKQKWQLHTGGEIRSSAFLENNFLYLNGGDGIIYSLDAANGKINWTFKTNGEHRYDFADYFNSSPVIANNVLYFGSGDSCVYALNAENGKVKWSFKTNGIVHTTPAIYKNKIYFGSLDGNVYALQIADGKLVWKFKTVGHDYFPKGEVQGSPTVFDGLVFIGARDYNFYCLDAERGYCHWNKAFSRGWALSANIYDSTLYIGSADERVLISADPATGKEHWNKKMEFLVFGNNAFTKSMLYVGTTIGKLHGIDLKTGEKTWSFQTSNYKKNRYNFFKEDDSYRDDIYSIIKSNEEFLDAEIVLGGVFSTPLVTAQYIVFTSTEGAVYCLERQ